MMLSLTGTNFPISGRFWRESLFRNTERKPEIIRTRLSEVLTTTCNFPSTIRNAITLGDDQSVENTRLICLPLIPLALSALSAISWVTKGRSIMVFFGIPMRRW